MTICLICFTWRRSRLRRWICTWGYRGVALELCEDYGWEVGLDGGFCFFYSDDSLRVSVFTSESFFFYMSRFFGIVEGAWLSEVVDFIRSVTLPSFWRFHNYSTSFICPVLPRPT